MATTTRVRRPLRVKTEEPRIVGPEQVQGRSRELFEAIALRAYHLFEERGRSPGHHEEDWFRAESELVAPVCVDVSETPRSVTVRAQVTGFDAEELEVEIEPRRVTLAGVRPFDASGAGGCPGSRFVRSVDLPEDVDAPSARISLKEGALQVVMRKAAPKVELAG